MKKLKLLITMQCKKAYEDYQNSQFDINTIKPISLDGKLILGYEEYIITGGEPLLKPFLVKHVVTSLRKNNKEAKITLHTAADVVGLVYNKVFDMFDEVVIKFYTQEQQDNFKDQITKKMPQSQVDEIKQFDKNPHRRLTFDVYEKTIVDYKVFELFPSSIWNIGVEKSKSFKTNKDENVRRLAFS